MYVIIQCSKCKNKGILKIGDSSKEEVNEFLKKRDFGECPLNGYHVEFGKMVDYITVDYSKRFKSAEGARDELRRSANDTCIKKSI